MCYCTYTVIDIPGFYMVLYLLFQGFSLPWIKPVNSTEVPHPCLIRPGSGWVVTFRCQYTLTSNNQLRGCLNPPCLVLFSAVDAVAKHSSVIKTTLNAFGLPKAFVSSAGILNVAISSLPVDNFHDRALWCKSTGINYNMHVGILCRYCATDWFWWISGLRAVTMWSSSSFTRKKEKKSDGRMRYVMYCTSQDIDLFLLSIHLLMVLIKRAASVVMSVNIKWINIG